MSGISAAPRRAHSSQQPTLSAQLKKLEAYLGVQLIERQPKQVTLTEAGEQIVARARRILEASDEVVALARSHRDPLAGRLRLAFLPTIGPYLLPRVAPKIRRALPRLELRLYEYQTAQMLDKLSSGEIDLGILALPVDLEGLQSRVLYEEPFTVALPSGIGSRKKQHSPRRSRKTRPCCFSRMAIACAIRPSRSAAGSQ